jgi:hypothetical protein
VSVGKSSAVTARHLREQRVEHHVVFAVEQDDLAPVRRQRLPQPPGALDTGKAAADDDDTDVRHGLRSPEAGPFC